MNDFSDLEAELKQLRPAAASPELTTRIDRALETATSTPTAGVLPTRKPTVNWFALGFGVAAAAAFLMLARVDVGRPGATQAPTVATSSPAARQSVPTGASGTLVPDGLTRVVYNTRDEGLVFPIDSEAPVRRVRSLTRETLAFKDPSSGASLRVSYPAEDIRYIPVSGQ